jgi:predicted Rossmann fold nucleotide-binding protein DprA/Smf involved in DNA uptake
MSLGMTGRKTAVYRNRFVAALAGTILIAYAHLGSSTGQLAQEALAWGKPVFTLAHPANEHLLRLGIRPYVPDNTAGQEESQRS